MSRLVITNCHLIDAVSDHAQPDASVAIEDGLITRIETSGNRIDADGARVIDAQGGWLLPGLWDVHVHLMFPYPPPRTIPERVVSYGKNAMEGLTESGVTGIRSGGIEHWIDVAWRDAFASGQYLGPSGLRLWLLSHHHRRPRHQMAVLPAVRRPRGLRPRCPQTDREQRRPH